LGCCLCPWVCYQINGSAALSLPYQWILRTLSEPDWPSESIRLPAISCLNNLNLLRASAIREWHSWVAPSEAHSTSEEAGGGTVRSTGGRSTGGWHRPKHRWHRPKHRWHRPKHTLVVAKAKLGLEPRCRNRFGALTLDGNRMQTRSRASSPTTAIGLAG